MVRSFRSFIASVLVLLLVAPALAAPFAFEDVDCDGVFGPGDNVINPGLPGSPPVGLSIFSEHCLVIPTGSISAKGWEYISVEATGHVTIGGILTTTTGPEAFGDASIKGGSMTVLSGSRWTSAGPIYVGANAGLLDIGDSVAFTSKGGYADVIGYNAAGVRIGKGLVVRALDQIDIAARRGPLTVKSGLNVLTGVFGPVLVSGKLGVDIDRATLKGYSVDVDTPAMPLRFTNSRIRFTIPAEGFGAINSHDFSQPCCVLGPVDVTGSQFPDGEVFIDGDPDYRLHRPLTSERASRREAPGTAGPAAAEGHRPMSTERQIIADLVDLVHMWQRGPLSPARVYAAVGPVEGQSAPRYEPGRGLYWPALAAAEAYLNPDPVRPMTAAEFLLDLADSLDRAARQGAPAGAALAHEGERWITISDTLARRLAERLRDAAGRTR